MERYGDYSAIGDTIGVLIEFNKEGFGSLTFYKNAKSFGMCYDGMPPNTYYPCIALSSQGREVIITLNSKAKIPFPSSRGRGSLEMVYKADYR